MSEAKHTSGPWEWVKDKDSHLYLRRSTTGAPILEPVSYAGENWISICPDDARMIGALPELLEALQSIADCCDEDHAARDYAARQTEIRGIARFAIAKATGEAA